MLLLGEASHWANNGMAEGYAVGPWTAGQRKAGLGICVLRQATLPRPTQPCCSSVGEGTPAEWGKQTASSPLQAGLPIQTLNVLP